MDGNVCVEASIKAGNLLMKNLPEKKNWLHVLMATSGLAEEILFVFFGGPGEVFLQKHFFPVE